MAENKISQAAVSRVEAAIYSILREYVEDTQHELASVVKATAEKAVAAVVAEGAKIVVPRSEDDTVEWIGMGIHTGLRKGTEAPGSAAAWRAINETDEGWVEAIEWFLSISQDAGIVTIADEEA